uniref:E3 ubiquitin-protein ligase n=1 Tax=Panagrolaimus sp. PS1159 TaxID=55785 RepID=A0AC35FZC7_9BILA
MIDKLIQAVREESWPEATKLLYNHWSEKCPKLYTTPDDEPWDNKVDEDSINKELLAPLAAMYILDNQETIKGEAVSLKPLTEKVGIKETLRKPGQLCGKMFKHGDPTYTCKECGLDDTCVLCLECFKQSPHAKHKYKMHSSYGTGYCDCGDVQAWSKDYACKLHTAEPQPGDEELNLSVNLPEEISTRIYNVTGIVLKYAVTLICWQDDENLPAFLHEPSIKPEFNYKTMLFNDETHTYDAVINALEVAIGCTSQQAMHLATIVDREGRSVVLSNTQMLCATAKKTIQHRTRRDLSRRTDKTGPLEVKIMTASLVSHQALAVKLLNWLTQQAQQFPLIAKIIADVVMKECSALCRLNSPDLQVSIPPPKPPRQMTNAEPSPDELVSIHDRNQVFEEPDILRGQFVIRPMNPEDEAVVINAAMDNAMNNPNVGMLSLRSRNFSTTQGKGPKVPKAERKYVLQNNANNSNNNKLSCGHYTTCTQLVLFDRRLWKAARINFHQLLMATVLMDLEHKKDFGVFMIKNFEFIYEDFINDDHEHAASIIALSVQVFTVSSVAQYLLSNENALAIIFETIKLHCHQYVKYSGNNERFLRFDFSTASMPAVLRRALTMFKDALYILLSSPMQWTTKMKESFINGIEVYVEILTMMQGMDEIKRQIDQHQMIESEWETAFNMQVQIQEITSMLIIWTKSNAYIHQRVAKIIIDRILDICSCMPEFATENLTIIDSFESSTIGFNVSRDYISIHHPLWRLFGGIFTASPEILKYYRFGEKVLPSSSTIYLDSDINVLMELSWKNFEPIDGLFIWPVHALLEMPLRILVLHAQCHSQLWRRNGYSLVNQIHNYTSPLCRAEMFDRDIQMMQICAAKMEPTEFLIRCLERFQLEKWARNVYEDLPLNKAIDGTPATPSSTPEELSKITVIACEEFFHLLIMIIGERYQPGIGKTTRLQFLEREILHLLCTKPQTYSVIEKTILLEPNVKVLEKDEALNRVADFHKPASTAAGTFHLKESHRNQYNPFFYHYSKQQHSQAELYQWREREKCPRHIRACPPPIAPEFEPFFEPILRIFDNPLFIRLLFYIISRFQKRSRYSSDLLFHRGLFLIGMAMNEEIELRKKNSEKMLNFVAQAETIGIFSILRDLSGKSEAESHQNLILWILDKLYEIKDSVNEKKEVEMASEEPEMDTTNNDDKVAKKKALAAKKLGFPVCLGPFKSEVKLNTSRNVKCILCQETEALSFNGKSMVCCGYLQNSKNFVQSDKPDNLHDRTDVFASAILTDGYSVSTCSHTMHFDCFKLFTDQLWSKERNRARVQILGQHIIDAESHEYLCPLCKRLSNCALPLIPSLDRLPNNVKKFSQTRPTPPENFRDWVSSLMRLANLQLENAVININPSATKSFKSHSRKRSHSEKSLLQLQEHFDGRLSENVLSSSQPSVVPLSPNAGELPMTPQQESGDTIAAAAAVINAVVPEEWVQNAVIDAAQQHANRASETGILNKFKNIINKPTSSNSSNKPESLPAAWNVIKPFFQYILQIGPDIPSNHTKELSEVTRLYKSMAFVLRSITTTLKVENKPLFGALNTRQRDCILCLSRIAAIASFQLKSATCRNLVSRILTPLLVPINGCRSSSYSVANTAAETLQESIKKFIRSPLGAIRSTPPPSVSSESPVTSPEQRSRDSDFKRSSPSTSPLTANDILLSHLRDECNILTVDMLTVAVELSMTIGSIWVENEQILHSCNRVFDEYKVPDGSVDELYSIHLALLGYIFQTMASFFVQDISTEDVEMADPDETFVTSENLRIRLENLFSKMFKFSTLRSSIDYYMFEKYLTNAVVEFLQPLALFYHAITLIPPPDSLKHTSYNEFESLCRYLGLPAKLDEILEGPFVDTLFEQWSEHLQVFSERIGDIPRQPIHPRSLVELPYEFTDLLTMCANYRCPSLNGNDHVTQPTMCLVCGKILCSQSYCCQRTVNDEKLGACSYHMKECVGKSGMFLRMRDCQIIMLTSRKRGAYKAAPYVDQFGETDNGFRRGNPLFLHPEMYKRFQRIWLHQEVAEEIINQYDINHRNINFEWNHF